MVCLRLDFCRRLVGTRLDGAAAGEPFDDRLGVRTPLVFLLMRSDIDAELGLEPPQVAEVKRFAADLYNRALRLRGRTDAGVVAARKEIDEAESAWMRTHLTPEQHERLGQIDLQWEGVSALLTRPAVADYLGTTSQEQDQVARLYSEAKKARNKQGSWTYEEHLELTRKALAVLAEKQKHLWAKVLGRPCHFVIEPAPHDRARTGAQRSRLDLVFTTDVEGAIRVNGPRGASTG